MSLSGVNWCMLDLILHSRNSPRCGQHSGEVCRSILWQWCTMFVWLVQRCWITFLSWATSTEASRKMGHYGHVVSRLPKIIGICTPVSQNKILPLVLKDTLTRGVWKVLFSTKVKRNLLQRAKEEIEKRQNSRCGICNQNGHYRSTCPIRQSKLCVIVSETECILLRGFFFNTGFPRIKIKNKRSKCRSYSILRRFLTLYVVE